MHITELRIRNFRNFLSSRLIFEPGVNTLIGENGSGKTNAFHALRLLLDENLRRNALELRESDFCRDLEAWKGQWIVISADFADLDPADGCQILRHYTGNMDGANSGTYSFIFRPKKAVRHELHRLAVDEPEQLREYLEALSVDDYEPVLTGRGVGDFLDDAVYEEFVGNPDTGEYPDPDEDDLDKVGIRIGPIYQEVACTFVRALRDVVNELRGYRSNPLLTLLRGMESEIKLEQADEIIAKVNELNDGISSLKEIKGLATGIEAALRNAVGLTYGPGVSIESALPNSLEKILQRLNVLVGDQHNSHYKGEIQEQSLGGANLIYLALKLLEYERKISTDRAAHFLLIEEPEAHIHTHIQKTLFKNLPYENTQVIVSTHSTHISSASRITGVNILAKHGDHAEVFQPARGLDGPATQRIERYLDAVRSTMLFAKGILLVEGDAEQILIPAMLEKVFGVSPDQLGFSVISMDSAFFEHISVLFSTERIRRPCAIVTDRDAPIFDLPDDPSEDDIELAHARAADRNGLDRQRRLQETADDNPWLAAFFAAHTFEVDFIAACNSHEIIDTLDKIYRRESSIEKSRKKLKSRSVSVYGKEVLRLAEKKGKGWFALLVAESLLAATYFPDYILRAVAFACHLGIDDSTLRQIGIFRMNEDQQLAEQLRSTDDYKELSAGEFVQKFCDEEPDDSLSLFRSCLLEFWEP